jgi:hypothetical protein
MGTAAHPIDSRGRVPTPTSSRWCWTRAGPGALLQPRAHSLVARPWLVAGPRTRAPGARWPALRRCATSASTATAPAFCALSAAAPGAAEAIEALEQLRALWHGHRIAVHVTATRPAPAWTRPRTWSACARCWRRQPSVTPSPGAAPAEGCKPACQQRVTCYPCPRPQRAPHPGALRSVLCPTCPQPTISQPTT